MSVNSPCSHARLRGACGVRVGAAAGPRPTPAARRGGRRRGTRAAHARLAPDALNLEQKIVQDPFELPAATRSAASRGRYATGRMAMPCVTAVAEWATRFVAHKWRCCIHFLFTDRRALECSSSARVPRRFSPPARRWRRPVGHGSGATRDRILLLLPGLRQRPQPRRFAA